MIRTTVLLTLTALVLQSETAGQTLDGFVFVQGAEYRDGQVRVEDFEILDHTVTNAEYKAFVDATGHETPPHWNGGQIPAGKEAYPVIFVNRTDVYAYLAWLTLQDGRVVRLPTGIEFRHAARGGLDNPRYPWGNDAPGDQANYDPDGTRRFNAWHDHLRPAKWGEPNGYGLFNMSGNVWQMVLNRHDPATMKWIYRLEKPDFKGQSVMGGSWARGPAYLRCGYRAGMQTGLRQPDLGFRPVREPEGHDWRVQPRRLCAVSRGDGEILVSWGALESDVKGVRFHVYRATDRNHGGATYLERTGDRPHLFRRQRTGSGTPVPVLRASRGRRRQRAATLRMDGRGGKTGERSAPGHLRADLQTGFAGADLW